MGGAATRPREEELGAAVAIELAWFPLDALPADLAFASHRQALAEFRERLERA